MNFFKKHIATFVLGSIVVVGVNSSAFAAASTFANKTISVLHLPDDRPCTFFRLDGVDVSDSSTPGNPWFAIRQTKNGYKETIGAIIGAKLSSRPITVLTSGSLIAECSGLPEVSAVELP